ncbi:hypothetical protein [Glaciecola sp. 33A]|uniref:hypothetical protein n=1 Tax=Glaciecola sp. 33A TaxID=2057807 RepID=UPI000C33CFE9|nr:hypothetical protein [Glaciecola sp. 33A]PKH99946.1 hypothetical protein CXF81_17370 [Glaciecola sp. 33A]
MCMLTVSIIRLLLLTAALSGCSSENTDKAENTPEDKVIEQLLSNDMPKVSSDTAELLVLKGQVLFQQMEGGFFGFIDENGNKYTPIGMSKADLRHGLVIQLSGKLLPNMLTTTQFGEVIKVESVVILDASNAQKAGRPSVNDTDL